MRENIGSKIKKFIIRWIKNFGITIGIFIWIELLLIIIIIIFLMISSWYETVREEITENKETNYKIERLTDMFWLTWKYEEILEEDEHIKSFYFPKNDKTIKIIKNDSHYWDNYLIADGKLGTWKNHESTWTSIRLVDNKRWRYWIFSYNGNEIEDTVFALELIKLDQQWWDIVENPDNFRISNTLFTWEYYKKYAELSWETLVRPNWAYYSGDYDENLIMNWTWIMHGFWTDISKEVKITDNFSLKVNDSCWFKQAGEVYSWWWKDWKRNGYGELYTYTIWGNRIEYQTWIYEDWEWIEYTVIGYQKINKDWWTFNEDPQSYTINTTIKRNKETWIRETHRKDMNWIRYTEIIDPNIDNWNPIYIYDDKKKTEQKRRAGWILTFLNDLEEIEPVLSWWKLYYWDKAVYSWRVDYINWKLQRSWEWKLTLNICDDAYLSWDWWQETIYESWAAYPHYKWNIEYIWNCWPYKYRAEWYMDYQFKHRTDWYMDHQYWIYEFIWEMFDSLNSYYKWKINSDLYYEWEWIRIDSDLEYYSWERNQNWEYEWFGTYRLYNEIISWWNLFENEDNYEVIYELSWWWINGNYIGKNRPEFFF